MKGIVIGLLVVLSVATRVAEAAIIHVNPAEVSFDVEQTVAASRFRLSESGFDQSIDNGAGTSNTSDYLAADIGHVSSGPDSIRGRSFQFSLQHSAGSGFTYSLTNVSSGSVSALRWGNFPATPGVTAATLGGLAADRPFNSLLIHARATDSAAEAVLSIAGLAITSSSAAIEGDFIDAIVNSSYTENDTPMGESLQRVIASIDLSTIDFEITGTLSASQLPGFSTEQSMELAILAQQGTPFAAPQLISAPEPGGLTLLAAGMAVGSMRVRRC